jgi:hypothetical protein
MDERVQAILDRWDRDELEYPQVFRGSFLANYYNRNEPMNAQIEGADASTPIDTTTLPQDPALKLTSDLMESARLVDEAFETSAHAIVATRDRVGELMAAFKAISAFIGEENAELNARLAGLEK